MSLFSFFRSLLQRGNNVNAVQDSNDTSKKLLPSDVKEDDFKLFKYDIKHDTPSIINEKYMRFFTDLGISSQALTNSSTFFYSVKSIAEKVYLTNHKCMVVELEDRVDDVITYLNDNNDSFVKDENGKISFKYQEVLAGPQTRYEITGSIETDENGNIIITKDKKLQGEKKGTKRRGKYNKDGVLMEYESDNGFIKTNMCRLEDFPFVIRVVNLGNGPQKSVNYQYITNYKLDCKFDDFGNIGLQELKTDIKEFYSENQDKIVDQILNGGPGMVRLAINSKEIKFYYALEKILDK